MPLRLFASLIFYNKHFSLFRNTEQNCKKTKVDVHPTLDESSDKTLFALLSLPAKVIEKPPQDVDTEKLSTFSNLLQKFTAEHSVETVSFSSFMTDNV